MSASRYEIALLAVLSLPLFVLACGPTQLSALGNPGDYCTESTACTDGSSCQQTDDGYRCVDRGSSSARAIEREGNSPSKSARRPERDEDAAENATDDESDGERDFADDEDDEDGGDGEAYVPPSRRRRGGRN